MPRTAGQRIFLICKNQEQNFVRNIELRGICPACAIQILDAAPRNDVSKILFHTL